MKYIKDFTFYLLPSKDRFDLFLTPYKSKDEIPSFNKKDFSPIVDIAVEYKVFENKPVYEKESKEKLIEHLKTSLDYEKLLFKLDTIYKSHMGVPFLYNLYAYSLFEGNKKVAAEKELNVLLNVINSPVLERFPDEDKKQKVKKLK